MEGSLLFSYCSTSAQLKLVGAEPCSRAPCDLQGPSGNSLCLLFVRELSSGAGFAGRTGSYALFRETCNLLISIWLYWARIVTLRRRSVPYYCKHLYTSVTCICTREGHGAYSG